MGTREEEYIKWLKKREADAYHFSVPVDNSRTNIIKIAMDDLVLRNNGSYFSVGIITDNEAALWMSLSENIPKLESTRQTRLLIAILNDEIKYVKDVIEGIKQYDKKARPTVEKMREMIEILEKPRPVPSASASAEPPAPEEPEDDKTKFSKMYPIPKTEPHALTVLNLPASATKKQIKTAYIKLSLLLHPDKNPPEDYIEYTVRQQQVAEAYNLLNPTKGGKKRRTTQRTSLKNTKSKKLNKHFKKSRRH